MMKRYCRGSVWYYNFGNLEDKDGSVQTKVRPCVIVSNDYNNTYSGVVIVAPITTRDKDSVKPWQAYYYNDKPQVVLCEQLRCVNIKRLYNYQGILDELTIKKINEALAVQLDLNIAEKELNSVDFLERLDVSICRLLKEKESKLTNKNDSTLEDILHTLNNIEYNQSQLSNMLTIDNSDDISKKLDDIKMMFYTQQKSLEQIINSLIGLYNDINKNKDDLETLGKTVISDNLKTITEIKDEDSNKESNIEDKDNSNIVSELNKSIYETRNINTENLKHGLNLGVKHKVRQERFTYTVSNALAFIDEWNNTTIDDMCTKYNITRKQLHSRKYLICKFLVSRNVKFETVNKSRGKKSKA